MKKTREQKIEKLEKKLAKLKIPKVNYKPVLDSLCYSIPMPTFYSVSDSFLGKETPKIKLIPKVNRSFNPSNVYPGNLYQAFATPKLEVGKWYKNTKMDYLFNFTKVNDEILKGYGFSSYGYGVDTWTNPNYARMNWRLATDKEVETALISEAKKRGFKEGVKVRTVIDKVERTLQGCFIYEYPNILKFYCSKESYNYPTIFKDGKWAEIIEDSKPKINGYEMEVEGNEIKFGCAKFYRGQMQDCSTIVNSFNCGGYKDFSNREIKSITLDSGVEITVGELKEVVDYLNK